MKDSKKKADKIIYGNIYTVDKKQPRAEAAAIKDGKFIYVGDEAGAKEYLGEGTEELRYKSGMILPGMGEGHGHVNPGGTEALYMVNLFPVRTLKEYRDLLKQHIEAHPEFDVVLGTGFVPIPDFEANGPNADMLEGLTDKPIIIADIDHHSYWVNHAAMDRLGINKDTPDVSDGIIVRNADGTPTGHFREGAMDLLKALTGYSVEQYKKAILYFQNEYLSHGETLVLDPIVNWDNTDNFAEACHQLDVEGKLRMHIYGAHQVFQAEGHDPIKEIEHAAEVRKRTKGRMFDLSNIKVQVDGTFPGNPATAYMKEPYSDPWSQEHHHRGQLRFDPETLTAVFKKSHELGMSVHVHAIGDGALAFALDAAEKALAVTGPADYRDAATHLQVVDPVDIPRMAKLGFVAVTDPHWFDMDPDYFRMTASALGEERAENQMPMKSFFDAGVVVTSASDYPVINPAYPLIGIQKGVMRQLPGRPETLLGANERVTVEQMIEATTLNEAYQMKCDDRLGSITVGKEADLVVLGTDITACAPEHIQDAPVLATMVGGDLVYDNSPK
ncbi:amidohydrolase [Oribacterium sp. FC2011]|uniref:amidohydrolase n=1 Tax=Oribacterium sp. FC2011 TaxID=1408311 RepID=UPI000678D250|nr:amidohydrolase [Oribacterium sp. FC2011]